MSEIKQILVKEKAKGANIWWMSAQKVEQRHSKLESYAKVNDFFQRLGRSTTLHKLTFLLI